MAHILIIEDDPEFGSILLDVLTRAGHLPLIATTLDEALDSLLLWIPELVMLDIGLPDGNGFAFVDALYARHRRDRPPIVVVSGHPDVCDMARGDPRIRLVIPKPCNLGEMMKLIEPIIAAGERTHDA